MDKAYEIKLSDDFEDFPQNDGLYIEHLHDEGILLDCKAFYFVFCDLEERCRIPWNDPVKMQKYDEDYINGKRPFLNPALVTNGILAAELALKYLTKLETGSFEYTHNIDKLFYSLPQVHRDCLSTMIKEKAHQNDKTLKTNLETIKNFFMDWRYFFQFDALGYSGFLNDFVHIVCDYAIDTAQRNNQAHRPKTRTNPANV